MSETNQEETVTASSDWSNATGLTDFDKLEKALRERSGGSMSAPMVDVFHLAQRRHRLNLGYDSSMDVLVESGKYIICHGEGNVRIIKPKNSP